MEKLLDRRRFLIGIAATSAALFLPRAAFTGQNFTEIIFEQKADWEEAGLPDDIFLDKYKDLLRRTHLGYSLSLEEIQHITYPKNPAAILKDTETLPLLDFLSQNLGMTNVRFGTRWWGVAGKDGHFSETRFKQSYRPLLNHLVENDVNITLNDGIIKTFRFPESHVPQDVLKKLEETNEKPKIGSEIVRDSELAEIALSSSLEFLQYLKANYDGKISGWQRENEPFHKYGIFGWSINEDYLEDSISQVLSIFPKANILVNSMGGLTSERITAFFRKMVSRNPLLAHQLTSGVDYYYDFPKPKDLPLLGNKDFATIPILGSLDIFSLFDIKENRDVMGELRQSAQEFGFALESTEAQMESWGSKHSPGDSAQEFKFVLLRNLRKLNMKDRSLLIRLWGVEGFAKNFIDGRQTEEQIRTAKMIKHINSYS